MRSDLPFFGAATADPLQWVRVPGSSCQHIRTRSRKYEASSVMLMLIAVMFSDLHPNCSIVGACVVL